MNNKTDVLKNKFTKKIEEIIDYDRPNDPVSLQFLTDIEKESIILKEEISDPIGDDRCSKIKGIIHRYPDRVLLIPKGDCLVTCRFCFRKWKLPHEKTELTYEELEGALDYIRSDPQIWEVVLSGGEPLATSEEKLEYIFKQLNNIPHIGVIRIHTRLPIVAPELVTEKTIKILKKNKPVFIVIHCNNEKEITDDVKKCCDLFVDSGIPLLSQTALLKGVNSEAEDLEALFRKLITIRVKPYYLHHCDLVEGTGHFRTTIKEGQALMRKLRGNVSGICQPTYVLDIPNGYGKVPIGPDYVSFDANELITVMDYAGTQHQYPPQ
ncbi:KamA family radical SAM protein [Clostridium aminobutyricum]|uniref:KamA family radical SAM protein n=1 Tax=Clostridium aminobutyricum TaxID=33953 RepID=A0A939IFV9_CLOAM|nr:KamA family radical SAM protein [Clostridium aminobutyricum]MBN7771985.1 KamA family radical SAM protein [Clostridium aminobutyricum]